MICIYGVVLRILDYTRIAIDVYTIIHITHCCSGGVCVCARVAVYCVDVCVCVCVSLCVCVSDLCVCMTVSVYVRISVFRVCVFVLAVCFGLCAV